MNESSPRRVLISLSILGLSTLPIAGCATPVPIVTTLAAFPCADMVPAGYRKPVGGPGLLSDTETAGMLAARYSEALGALETANGHTADVIQIVDRCDARMAQAAEKLKPTPWWRSFTRKRPPP